MFMDKLLIPIIFGDVRRTMSAGASLLYHIEYQQRFKRKHRPSYSWNSTLHVMYTLQIVHVQYMLYAENTFKLK